MPELPEVECIRRGLVAAKVDSVLTKIWRSQHNLRIGRDWSRDLEGLEVLKQCIPGPIERRGKYLMWSMSSTRCGTALPLTRHEVGLVIHLGMSGRCGVVNFRAPIEAHTHLRLQFADGRELRFIDPRRFGGLRAGSWKDILLFRPIAALGPEPMSREFSGKYLQKRVGHSQRILRDILLDQRVIAGIGNIYAIEALYVSGIHPFVPADKLRINDWNRVAVAVRSVLRGAIRYGGTTLKDYRDVSGAKGNNQGRLLAYGRAGQKCGQCGAILEAFVHGGRSGTFCPKHQCWMSGN